MDAKPQKKVAQKTPKGRHNFSISSTTLEMLRRAAEKEDCSMSALLTRWILEKTSGM
jgi:hypothetical protein